MFSVSSDTEADTCRKSWSHTCKRLAGTTLPAPSTSSATSRPAASASYGANRGGARPSAPTTSCATGRTIGDSHHKSYPITVEQAKQLIREIDKKSADFLRTIAHNDGEATFKSMCEIFDIERWAEYSGSYGKGITRALRHMTDNSSASLIWWNDDEWVADEDPNGSVYIDGQALRSLQAAFGF